MTDYPQEVIEKAAALLLVNLRYLFLEMELYADTAPNKFVYTNDLSTLFHRLAECQMQAEVTNNQKAVELLEEVAVTLENLRTNYTGELHAITSFAVDLKDFVEEMENKEYGSITMGEYKEK